MIKATVKNSSLFVDKPKKTVIMLNEKDVALERKNEQTNKLQKITVGELYNLWYLGHDYIKVAVDPSDQITAKMFMDWFSAKHLHNKPIGNNIIGIEFEKT
jgi:predicted metal-dependent hydrolase